VKDNVDGTIDLYKSLICAKDYKPVYGVGYLDTFSAVADNNSAMPKMEEF
jgi:hypothetical protein